MLRYALEAGDVMSMEMGTDGTLTESLLTVSFDDAGTAYVNSVEVVETDILTTNGVIHALDEVLLPPGLMEQMTDEAMSQTDENPADDDMVAEPDGAIGEIVAQNDTLETLAQAVEAAGLTATLNDESATYTLFAPTNAAFEVVPDAALAYLLENPDTLAQVLLYHVAEGSYTADELATLDAMTSGFNELDLTLAMDGDSLMVGSATVIEADIPATNGMIHAIDSVLLPPTVAETLADEGLLDE